MSRCIATFPYPGSSSESYEQSENNKSKCNELMKSNTRKLKEVEN